MRQRDLRRVIGDNALEKFNDWYRDFFYESAPTRAKASDEVRFYLVLRAAIEKTIKDFKRGDI